MNLKLLSGELEEYREARKYWTDMLSGNEEAEMLASAQPVRLQNPELFREQRLALPIDTQLTEGLLKWSSRKDYLLYVVLLSGVLTTLHKLGTAQAATVGCPAASGSGSDTEAAANRYLPIRLRVDGSHTVKQLWKQLNGIVSDAYQYGYYPIEQLCKEIGIAAADLFHAACLLEPMHHSRIQDESIAAAFVFRRSGESVSGELVYNAAVYSEDRMRALARSFMYVLEQMTENPDLPAEALRLVNSDERNRLLTGFHCNQGTFPAGKSVGELFEEQVDLTPDGTALVCGSARLSYRELNARAGTLAEQLRMHGIERGHIAGVVCDRTVNMIIAMLAVIKTGAAYLPIDPYYPQERIRYMLEDSGAAVVITPPQYAGHVPMNGDLRTLQLEQYMLLITGSSASEREMNAGHYPEKKDIAYVIYTSGSTGKPKGVMVGHQGMANLHAFFRNELGIRESDKIVQFASASFDASVWEMFMAFFTGAELHLLAKETIESYEAFTAYACQAEITVATLPPIYASHLEPDRLPALRMLVTAGSASSPEMAGLWGRHLNYVNAYGPTESTICATFWQTGANGSTELLLNLESMRVVPIGKPIINTQIYIVNREQHLLPVGFMGELCIGGVPLALGYLGQDSLTDERFVDNPFVPGEKMYRTGDYARWLPDGNIEFMGRIDHQVKIRGFRIEPGEIEVCLLQHPDIEEACVAAKEDLDGQLCLAAYIAPENGQGTDSLKKWLAERLPPHLMPQYYVPMSKLPLTPSGKVDNKALPHPAVYQSGGKDAASDPGATATERKLAELWKRTLGTDCVSLQDHYFECGGHSLKAAELITEIHRHFQIQLSLRNLMENPTLQGMAGLIERSLGKRPLPYIAPASPMDDYPLSLAQKRLFILNQYHPEQLTYNIPVALRISGPVRIAKLEQALDDLAARHEILRTSFMLLEGNPVQQVQHGIKLCLEFSAIKEHELAAELQRFVQPFDLAKAPLIRACLFGLADEDHVLCLDMHHMISDGISMTVLIHDLMKLYCGKQLEPLSIQYKDYAIWQRDLLESGELAEQETFWLNEFADTASPLQIETDYPRQVSYQSEDAAVHDVLPANITQSLHAIAFGSGSTLYMVLLSAYSILLSLYSGQKDIVVGTPVAGRSVAELQPLIGMFVNMVAIRSKPGNGKTFTEYLAEVREKALSAFECQDYPFDELVRRLNIPREPGRNPLFDASFALQNMDLRLPEIDGLGIKPVDPAFYRAKFDLTLWAEEEENSIRLMLEYRTGLFKKETAENMLQDLKRIIEVWIDNPQMQLGGIDLRTEEEKEQQQKRMMELEAALEMDFDL